MTPHLAYIPRIRAYYQALGYGAPYEWTRLQDVAFKSPQIPLDQMRVAIVTTAAPFKPNAGDQGPGADYNGAAKFFEPLALPTEPMPRLGISHIAYDRTHTTAEDKGSFFPHDALLALDRHGQIGSVSPRFYALPTNRSVRQTRLYADAIVEFARDDQVDAIVLVPNCPVCHQSCALTANTLEAAGVCTVVMGAALDIVEHIGVPRLYFTNMPLGNAAGPPHNPDAQQDNLRRALNMIHAAQAPRTTEVSPHLWPGDPEWQRSYSNAELLSTEEIAQKRAEFDRVKAEADKLRGR